MSKYSNDIDTVFVYAMSVITTALGFFMIYKIVMG